MSNGMDDSEGADIHTANGGKGDGSLPGILDGGSAGLCLQQRRGWNGGRLPAATAVPLIYLLPSDGRLLWAVQATYCRCLAPPGAAATVRSTLYHRRVLRFYCRVFAYINNAGGGGGHAPSAAARRTASSGSPPGFIALLCCRHFYLCALIWSSAASVSMPHLLCPAHFARHCAGIAHGAPEIDGSSSLCRNSDADCGTGAARRLPHVWRAWQAVHAAFPSRLLVDANLIACGGDGRARCYFCYLYTAMPRTTVPMPVSSGLFLPVLCTGW
jgi:hypothetical protein